MLKIVYLPASVCTEASGWGFSGRLVVVLDGDDEKVVKVRDENLEELSEVR